MRAFLIFSALLLAIFMVNFELTAIFLILPDIAQDLHLSMSHMAWVILLYQVLFASVLVVAGRIGDLLGRRNIFAFGSGIFVLASLLGGGVHSLLWLLVARGLQGFSGALIWPNAMAMAFSVIPEKHKRLGVGCLASVIGLALVTGPVLSGYIAMYWGWQWVFWINVPIFLFAVFLVCLLMINRRAQKKSSLDLFGAAVLVVFFASLVLSITQCSPHSALHAVELWFIVLTVCSVVILYWVERRAKQPILPIDLLKNKPFLMVSFQRFVTAFPLYVILFFFSLYAQKSLGLSPILAGGFLFPMTLMIAILSPLCGKLSDWTGPKKNLFSALIIYIAWLIIVLFFGLKMNADWLGMSLILPGLAYALASPAALSLTVQLVPEEMHGVASGIFYMLSVFSGLLAVALSTVVMHVSNVNFESMRIIILMMLVICCLGFVVMWVWLYRFSGSKKRSC